MKRVGMLVLSCICIVVITNCASTKSEVNTPKVVLNNPDDTAGSIKYNEIQYSELENILVQMKGVNSWKGIIVNAYVQRGSEYYNYQDSLKISEKPLVNQIIMNTSHNTNGVFKFKNLQADKILDVDKNKFDPNKLCKVYIAIYNEESYITKVDGMITDDEIALKEQNNSNEEKAALEKLQNPDELNRSEYNELKAEEFSFEMTSGKLPVGAKIVFIDNFLTKPTDNSYKFNKIDKFLSLKSNHDFVSNIPERCFTGFWLDNYVPTMTTVKVYVTVKRVGKTGECSIDIVEW